MRKCAVILLILSTLHPLGAQESVNRILLPYLKDSTRAVAGYQMRNEQRPRSMQEGSGISEGYFDASSLKRLSKDDAFEGSITYRRGKRKGIRWNTGSDYDLLYPYVLADSLSGDLSKESYDFYGGYSHRSGNLLLGGKFSYRALHEYRDTDPRPRAITSDFKATVSLGYVLGNNLLDISAGYRRYHQSLGVTFMNRKGANTAEFHMTGLGSHFRRFESTGGYTNTRYRGEGFNAYALLSPMEKYGLSASAGYEYFHSTRHLVSQNEAPITELSTHTLSADVSWRGRTGRGEWAAGVEGSLETRLGTENIVSNLITGNFGTLLEMRMYSRYEYGLSLWGEFIRAGLKTRPSVSAYRSEESHKYPGRNISMSILSADIPVRYSLRVLKMSVGISAGAGADFSPSSLFSIPEEYTMPLLLADMRSQFEVLTDTRIRLMGGISLSKDIGKGVSLTLDAAIERWKYIGGYSSTLVNVCAGVRF